MRKSAISAVILAVWLGAWAAGAQGAVTAKREDRYIHVRNDVLAITIDLQLGARVTEYVYAPFKENLVYPVADAGGLLMDHVTEQTWPGEFLSRMYEAEIVKAGPDEAVVRVWTIGQGETVEGVRFQRTITLRDGERWLHCEVALANEGKLGRITNYWSQNNFWLLGRKENNTWYRPCTRGIDVQGYDWSTYRWYYVEDVTAGWNGVANGDLGVGVMFLMDYNDLWKLYDNQTAVTTEWMYDKVAIPAGKTWKTDIYIIPVSGVSGLKHGSKDLLANFTVTEETGALQIEHELSQGTRPLKDVTVRTRAGGLKADWQATVPEAKLEVIDESVQKLSVKATGVGVMPAGIEVTVTGTGPDGAPVTVVYGDYYGGSAGKNNDPFTMEAYLEFKRPPKVKVYLKPEDLTVKHNPEPRLLYMRGVWTEFFRLDEGFADAFPKGERTDGWLDTSPVGVNYSYFPADYGELLAFDVIALGNVPVVGLADLGQEMLTDYVKGGGGLLVLGGDQSYGQSGFSHEGLKGLMPVEIGDPFDWRKVPGGAPLAVAGRHPITQGVEFGGQDVVLYRHIIAPKADAAVLVTAGGQPILIAAQVGAGRIACVLAAPFGEAPEGKTAFWDSAAWRRLMANTVRWLAGK